MLDAPVLDAAGVERGGGAVLERAVGGEATAHRNFAQAGTTVVAALELRRGRHGHGDRGAARLHRQRGRPGRATKGLQDAIHRVALLAAVRGSVAAAVVLAVVLSGAAGAAGGGGRRGENKDGGERRGCPWTKSTRHGHVGD